MYKYTLSFVSLCINIHRNSVIPALFRARARTDANKLVSGTLRIALSVSRLCFVASPDARSGVTEEPLSPARRGFTALPKSLRRVPATALPCCRKAFFAWRNVAARNVFRPTRWHTTHYTSIRITRVYGNKKFIFDYTRFSASCHCINIHIVSILLHKHAI